MTLRYRIAALTLILSLASGMAMAQETGGVEARLAEIRRMVLDPGQMFSISATLSRLDSIAAGPDEGTPRLKGEIAELRNLILTKANRPAEALTAGLEALRLQAEAPFLSRPDEMRLRYRIAGAAEDERRWTVAVEQYRAVLPLMDADTTITDDQRFGTRERLASCLHEAGDYAGALALNREVLAGGEKLHGADSNKLLTVLNNLAQNAYELKDVTTARRMLERRLEIATRSGETEKAEDTQFQLGVLAFEGGHVQEAETWMKQRLDSARKSGVPERLEAAQRDLDELYARLKKQ